MTGLTPCPRCGGQLYTETDRFGDYLSCLQCGSLQPLNGYDQEAKLETNRHPGNYRTGRPHLRGRTYNQRHR